MIICKNFDRMKIIYSLFLTILFSFAYTDARSERSLLEDSSNATTVTSTNHETKIYRNSTSPPIIVTSHNQKEPRQVAADTAIAIIIVIVLCTIFLMAIYFIRKFDQLNRMVPSYRYSSLKTEINGILGNEDKIESQALVSESTEEEDDFEDGDDVLSPPTLLVQSQTTVPSSKSDSNASLPSHTIPKLLVTAEEIKGIITIDSDDELLQ